MAMDQAEAAPRALLAFIIFIAYKRGNPYVDMKTELLESRVPDPACISTCKTLYRLDKTQSIRQGQEDCVRLLANAYSGAEKIAAVQSHTRLQITAFDHASSETMTTTPPARYILIHGEDQTFDLRLPHDSQALSEEREILLYINDQLLSHDGSTQISRIKLVDSHKASWIQQHVLEPLAQPKADTFPALFQRAAQVHSQRVAVEAHDRTLTYLQLDTVSTALSTTLTRLGLRPGDCALMALPWSSWTPILALAIQKARASFCLIDHSSLAAEVDECLRKTGAKLLLSYAGNHDQLAKCALPPTMVESLDASTLFNADEQIAPVQHHDPAYILFTSGSTGTPKVVVYMQHALSAGAEHQAIALGLSSHSRVLGAGPLWFASAIPKLLFSLLVGACICIPDDINLSMSAATNRHNTNFLILTASIAAKLDPGSFKVRQTVVVGAEMVRESTATLWAASHELRLAYGASEMNTVITGHPWSQARSSNDVGRSKVHQFWIVDPDDSGKLLPPGWPGEVLVESAALASEYLGNSTATCKAFLPTPEWAPEITISRATGPADKTPVATRWYRSGDLGRLHPATMSLNILGRIDPLQSKLQHGRVDLAGLESAAEREVRGPLSIAVELGLPRGETHPLVVAFIVSSSSPGLKVQNEVVLAQSGQQLDPYLRDALSKAWPHTAPYWPAYVVVLESLPRLSTSKVWRHLLRSWIAERDILQLQKWRFA